MQVSVKRFNLANKLSVFRLLAVPVFFSCILRGEDDIFWRISAWIFFICAITDTLDGLAARLLHQESKIGAVLDPLADKLLLVSAYIGLTHLKLLPEPISAFLILRAAAIAVGWLFFSSITHTITVQPTKLGKLTIVLEMLLVLSLLSRLPNYLVNIFVCLVVIFAAISLLDYLVKSYYIIKNSLPLREKK